MNVKSRKQFFTDLSKIKSRELLDDIQFIYKFADVCKTPDDIPGFKYLTGYTTYARISIEDYRIGIQIIEDTIIFICALHRSIVYERFP
jgi:mRNA interferase RelE/StbE